jgi:hypothetical protein
VKAKVILTVTVQIDPMHSYALTLKGQLAMNLTGSSEDSLKALELFERVCAVGNLLKMFNMYVRSGDSAYS